MPYVRGPSLQRRLNEEGPLAVVEILRVAMQAAAGLAAAHAQGLVHRDVKPANILLADGIERVKLTDFGLARAADDASLTRTGVIAGTPQYMSPEQARGEPVDPRSDLFSLGSVLYAMCTGRPPFRAETSYGVLRRITDEEPRPIREINPDIPHWLCGIVARLMAKKHDDRFQSAGEVAALLEQCLAHVQQPTTVPLPKAVVVDTSPTRKRVGDERPIPQQSLLARASGLYKPPLLKGTLAMLTLLSISLFAAGVVSTSPPDISGNWQGDDLGRVTLTQTAPGEYTGTYTDTVAKEKGPGKVELKWSRIERRFNGTWREGENDRFGDLSVRLVDKEIRGALTTDPKSKINPATPRLADLLWRRGESATNAPHAHALQFDGEHYAKVEPPPRFTSDDFTVSLWFNSAASNKTNWLFMRGFGYREQRGDVGLGIDPDDGKLDFVAIIANYQFIFGWSPIPTRLSSAFERNRWNHVVVTRRGDTYSMWMNGARVGVKESSVDFSDAHNTTPFIIGGFTYESGVRQLFQGALDDFRIFRRCLSDKEIADLFRSNGDETVLSGEGRVKVGQLRAARVSEEVSPAGPVQWSEARGGNGHWYQAVSVPGGITWTDAKQAAEAKGGYLATITSAEENAFVYSLLDDDRFWHLTGNNDDGPWLGGAYDRETKSLHWITGEPWDYTNWYPTQPNRLIASDHPYPQDSLLFYGGAYKRSPTWANNWHDIANPVAYVIEWNIHPPFFARPTPPHALQFDGNGGTYVEVANPTGLPTGMGLARTLAAWFKLASVDEGPRGYQGIWTKLATCRNTAGTLRAPQGDRRLWTERGRP